MPRPRRELPSPSALAPALLRYLRVRGLHPEAVAARFAMPEGAEDQDQIALPPSVLGELLEAAADALGEPHLALRLPAELPLRRYGLAELASRASATLREALDRMARYAKLVHPSLVWALEEDGEEARWRQSTPGMPRGAGRLVHEYGLAYVLTEGRLGQQDPPVPRAVWFAHARPPDLGPLHRFFGTPEIRFGCVDSGFSLPRDVLERPRQGADPKLLATVETLADASLEDQPAARSVTAVVAARIPSLLPADATLEAAARTLRLSARTLQRRLEEEGTRFSEILDGVRQELARKHLATPTLALAEVAYRLGFSDLPAFTRAFKRWTGKPPGTFRQSMDRVVRYP